MAGPNGIEYHGENTEAVAGKLIAIADKAENITAKAMEKSIGEVNNQIGALEEEVVKINQTIGDFSRNTAILLGCLASTWKEFDERIHQSWQEK